MMYASARALEQIHIQRIKNPHTIAQLSINTMNKEHPRFSVSIFVCDAHNEDATMAAVHSYSCNLDNNSDESPLFHQLIRIISKI